MAAFSDIAEQPCFMPWLMTEKSRLLRSAAERLLDRPPRSRSGAGERAIRGPGHDAGGGMSMYRFALVALLCAAALPSPSRAQSYPSKPIHFILPYVPGGIIDTAGRH